jgi:rRNA-processing protein FCF1
MCIIIDANCVHHVVRLTDDGKPVVRWLLKGKGGLVVGGKIKRELSRAGFGPTMIVLSRAGRLKQLDDDAVDGLEKKIKEQGRCKSNDPHVLAVAVMSGCRLVFSNDQDLHTDAKNRTILDPPASIYQSEDHEHLLTECKCN